MKANLSQVVESAGNFTQSLNYSEALQVVSRPESAEQALLLFQSDNPMAVALILLAFVPPAALFVVGGAMEKLEDFDFWVLLLTDLFFSVLMLGLVPFLISV